MKKFKISVILLSIILLQSCYRKFISVEDVDQNTQTVSVGGFVQKFPSGRIIFYERTIGVPFDKINEIRDSISNHLMYAEKFDKNLK